jgi:hypothetical protein
MTEDEFDNVYHLLQSEKAAFFTALTLEGLEVGAVHTDLDLSEGVDPGELDPRLRKSLQSYVVRRGLRRLMPRAPNDPDSLKLPIPSAGKTIVRLRCLLVSPLMWQQDISNDR